MSPISSQNTSTNNETYTPPRLPRFLTDAHNLKPIVGVPADEEVKAIHAAIRAVDGILNVPSLYDPDLPIQLAQHLFNVQMAVYRSTHPFGVFPGNATYTPPSLPSHIPVTLEPVVGAPSDEQLKVAQNAVRAIENLANTPAIFDPDLSMSMSQHLFNLQIARYIQLSTQGKFITEPRKIQAKDQDGHLTLGDNLGDGSGASIQMGAEDEIEHTPGSNPVEDIRPAQLFVSDITTVKQSPQPMQTLDSTKDFAETPQETNRLFTELGAALQNINQAAQLGACF